jgi:SAM-dependent methyltransferase
MNTPQQLRDGVYQAYSAVAEQPEAEHPFAVGKQFAAGLGYPMELLDRLPPVSVQAFTGVSNVSLFADVLPGARVLDLGCGAGMDSVIAAERAGPAGSVIGVDFSQGMLARARGAASEAGLGNVHNAQAGAENLPLQSGSVDVALVNGLFNLNPARGAIFQELARVVRPGGSVFAAELILREPAPAGEAVNLDDWFS